MNTHTVTHIDDMVDTPFNGRSNYIVDFSKVGTSNQITFSVTPKLPKGIYAYEMNIELSSSVGYNVLLWGRLWWVRVQCVDEIQVLELGINE